jgi:hypothetical protein
VAICEEPKLEERVILVHLPPENIGGFVGFKEWVNAVIVDRVY